MSFYYYWNCIVKPFTTLLSEQVRFTHDEVSWWHDHVIQNTLLANCGSY